MCSIRTTQRISSLPCCASRAFPLTRKRARLTGTGDSDMLVAEGFRVVSDSYKRLLVASRSDLGLKKTVRK
jgi:hypothetical protein